MQDFKKRGYGAWLYTINDTGVSGVGCGGLGPPCILPHASGVKVPPTVPFNLSGYLRTY